MPNSVREWISIITIAASAVIVYFSASSGGQWGNHGVFIAAYAVIGIYCLARRLWMGVALCASLVLLRTLVEQRQTGVYLELASTLFVVVLLAACLIRAGDLKTRA